MFCRCAVIKFTIQNFVAHSFTRDGNLILRRLGTRPAYHVTAEDAVGKRDKQQAKTPRQLWKIKFLWEEMNV